MDEDSDSQQAQFPVSGLLRQARRRSGLSQRELARRAGVSSGLVGRAESGDLTPALGTLLQLLAATGLHLVVVDAEGRVVRPLEEFPGARDAGGRLYPAHLDLVIDPDPVEWWGARYGLARPPQTFHRDLEDVGQQLKDSYNTRRGQWITGHRPGGRG
jgi:transcriptional regulator with XRE-family HTH domain